MKSLKRNTIFALCTAFALIAATVSAGDYSSMTTEELSQLRGTMFNAPQEEKDAFRAEWLKRVEGMSEEDKAKYFGSGPGRGQGKRNAAGIGDGSGRGKGGGAGGGQGQNRASQ